MQAIDYLFRMGFSVAQVFLIDLMIWVFLVAVFIAEVVFIFTKLRKFILWSFASFKSGDKLRLGEKNG
jgi:hypothetical protein